MSGRILGEGSASVRVSAGRNLLRFDRNLCVMEVQVCMIGCGNRDCIHYRLLLMIFMLIALWGIIAENGWSGNIMRGEVFWGIVEKYWVLNAWCDILKKECLCLRWKYKYPF